MKKLLFFMAFGLVVMGTGACWAGPEAAPLNKVYEFAPVFDGKGLSHTFIVKNSGDTELTILGVLPP